MHFTSIATLFSVLAAANAQLTFNITRASAPGNMAKYRCLNNNKLKGWLPSCIYECQVQASMLDGCAAEDFACHCVNHYKYSKKLIEPCTVPPGLGGTGHCTVNDLYNARPVIDEMCNFYNATIYKSYEGCPQRLSRTVTYGIIMNEGVVITQ
ncbi:hypothetical protein COCCADRAFT_109128 [Bipolaris zeicola 26-R-13]|uniref:CFEM domain-containing protein n=1 Tax=Cochliobolus carbonum (strain 26-R-13) TaxID=930089 RepID=W6YBB5_COCC2|nr:uncharacterized protein COCCADRAFT_109128 [Bipolaris zeicola 26-R-13]EUC28446.1 hypothetical protein COCCADRAFT_109128 [Bipolaris zeicola 26-R-13]